MGENRLFPELTKEKEGYSTRASKWFSYYCRNTCGIPERTKSFHSFRHTFSDAFKQSLDVKALVVKQLLGHRGDDITFDMYARRFPVKMLLVNGILKLRFDVDLEHLNMPRCARSGSYALQLPHTISQDRLGHRI